MNHPETLLSRLTSGVNEELVFKFAAIDGEKIVEEEITNNEKQLFHEEKVPEEELFPELKDGATIEIEGKLTKGNERTNTLGVEYKSYILNCHPATGGVVKYKNFLFTKCRVQGIVDRRAAQRLNDKKPRIVITDIFVLEDPDATSKLFDLPPRA